MGEARRKRLAGATARPAGDPLEYWNGLLRAWASPRSEVTVPCENCRACCYHLGVDVDPTLERAEDLAHLDLVERDGGWFLRKREDGACVHLTAEGCSVHQHRPLACRSYDCRAHVLTNVLDSYGGGRVQPVWRFDPSTGESRVFLLIMEVIASVVR